MAQVSVSSTPVKVSESDLSTLTEVIVYHEDETNFVYLGMNANVSASNGLPLVKGTYLSLEIKPYEAIYAVSSAGTVKVCTLVHVSPHARNA